MADALSGFTSANIHQRCVTRTNLKNPTTDQTIDHQA
jgi:hypothetical protein